MPIAKVKLSDGRVVTLEVAEGTTPEQIQSFMETQLLRPAVDESVLDANDQRAKAPRQRTVLDDVARFLEVNPVSRAARGAMQPLVGAAQAVANLTPWGDKVNQFVTEEERGYQAQRKAAGQTGLDIANMVGQAGTYVASMGRLAPFGAASLPARVGNAALQGAVAGATQPVIGADEGKSFAGEKAKQAAIGAATGAVLTPPVEWATSAVVGAVNGFLNSAKSLGNRIMGMNTPQLQQQLTIQLQQQGIDWARLPQQVQDDLLQIAQQAARTGGRLSPEQMARLADYQTLGIQPLRSWVTRNPTQFTQEANLAKQQANQEGGVLVDRQVAANNRFNEVLNDMGAANAGSRMEAGQGAIDAINAQADARNAYVRMLYERARNLNGGDIPLEARLALQNVIRDLEQSGKLSYLGAEGGVVNQIIDGTLPLTVGRAENIKSTLAEGIRTAQRAGDGNRVFALQQVYGALENAQPAVQLGQQAMQAFRQARDAARRNFQWRESSPAVQAALDNVAPDNFFQQFVLNRSAVVRDVEALRNALPPQLREQNRNIILQHLRNSAARDSAIDAGATFSQAGYRNALEAVGPEKLAVFFSPEEMQVLDAIRRASYNMVAQPKGSAVNNSNTSSALYAMLDRLIRKVPFGDSAVGGPMRAIATQRLESAATAAPQPFVPGQAIDPEMARRLLAPVAPALGALAAP